MAATCLLVSFATDICPGHAQNSLQMLYRRVSDVEETLGSLECVAANREPTINDCHLHHSPRVITEGMLEARLQLINQRLAKVQDRIIQNRKEEKSRTAQ